jgi:hypothetical protein
LAGADLRATRGHRPGRPAFAAPEAPTRRLVAGEATATDIAAIEAWQRPAWLPQDRFDMSDDTAAAVSQLGDPNRWGHVTFTPAPAGEPWTMTVEYTRGYPRSVQIPGGAEATELLHWLADEEIDFDVGGY